MIQAEKISFQYSSRFILADVSFTIQEGAFAAITGTNGSGKSTLLKLLLQELQPQKGSITLFNQDAAKFKAWNKIGYVAQAGYQNHAQFPATVEEVVCANLYTAIGPFRFPAKVHQQAVMKALELVDMKEYAKALNSTLSGGQRQRVMLARALVHQPSLLILDEPTTGIDSHSVDTFYHLLQKLHQQGITILIVTHDMVRCSSYVTATYCLEDGNLIELDKEQLQEELRHKHKHPHTGGHRHAQL